MGRHISSEIKINNHPSVRTVAVKRPIPETIQKKKKGGYKGRPGASGGISETI